MRESEILKLDQLKEEFNGTLAKIDDSNASFENFAKMAKHCYRLGKISVANIVVLIVRQPYESLMIRCFIYKSISIEVSESREE
jgi:hypothetical protein